MKISKSKPHPDSLLVIVVVEQTKTDHNVTIVNKHSKLGR